MSATGISLQSEWSILIAACPSNTPEKELNRLQPLLQGPVQWKLLFALAERHGVQPLLFRALDRVAEAVPAEEIRCLRQAHQTNLHKALLLSRELIRITQYLSSLDIEILPYKGLALAEALYGDIALRQAGDIDLLIRREDFTRVREALAKLGYAPHVTFSSAEERAYRKSGYESAFDAAAGRNILEVQWAFQPRFYSVDFDMDAIFERAIDVIVAGQPMRTPSYADQLLTLSVHAAKHVWGRLIWLCDIARLMRLTSLDWNSISSQARNLGIVRIVGVSMILASRLLQAEIPPGAQASLTADRSITRLADEIQSYTASGTAFNVESFAYFRLMTRLRERVSDRLRFFGRLAFTAGPGEWQAVRLPAPLFPLYRLVRVSRLAGRILTS